MTKLSEIKILDLSHRLPGPLAGKILCDLGMQVIKVEDSKFKDPFLSGLFNESDNHFITWYETLNQHKKVIRFDFNKDNAKEKMSELLSGADAVILALPAKIKVMLGLEKENLEQLFPNLSVVELKASRGPFKNLHDLNAIAVAGLLDMHLDSKDGPIIKPPFLPVAGISFGHWVATNLLASLLEKRFWQEVDLQEATEKILGPFKSSIKGEPRYLHNGKFPCYCLYKTKDHKALAVAAVEDKFWKTFNELFDLNLSMEDRFDVSDITFSKVAESISQMDSSAIAKLLVDQDICVNIV